MGQRVVPLCVVATIACACTMPNPAFFEADAGGGTSSSSSGATSSSTGAPATDPTQSTTGSSSDGSSSGGSTALDTGTTSDDTTGEPTGTTGEPEPPTLCGLNPGDVEFGPVQRLDSLSTDKFERNPYVSANLQRMYFLRLTDDYDIYVTGLDEELMPGSGNKLPGPVNSPAKDARLTLYEDELGGIFSTDRVGTGFEGWNLWEFERESLNVPFEEPTPLVSPINSDADIHDPHLAGGGLRLYFSVVDNGVSDIYMSQRESLVELFSEPVPIPSINVLGADEGDPSLTEDERVMVFSSDASAPDDYDLYVAIRNSRHDAFEEPKIISGVSLPDAADDDPHISLDGCHLWFSSNRDAQNMNSARDLYFVSVIE